MKKYLAEFNPPSAAGPNGVRHMDGTNSNPPGKKFQHPRLSGIFYEIKVLEGVASPQPHAEVLT